MKKVLKLILFLNLITTSVICQEYLPIVKEGNSWNMLSVIYIPGDPLFDTSFSTITYKIFEDTVINGSTYHIISSSTEEYPLNWQPKGYIREDSTHKVWMREEIEEEDYLLYDFGVSSGDTVHVGLYEPVPLIVDSITLVEIEGVSRFKYWLTHNDYHEYWITGIGSNKGICFSGSEYLSGGWYWLLCMSDTSGPVFENPDFESCYLISGYDNYDIINYILYPNPAHDFINVTTSIDKNGTFLYEILDQSGRKLKAGKVNIFVGNFTIDISRIPNGTYILKLNTENQTSMQFEKL